MKRFYSFAEMLGRPAEEGSEKALSYFNKEHIDYFSFEEFKNNCFKEKERYLRLGVSSLALIEEKTPSLVFSLFGAVLAGLDTCLIDPSENEKRVSLMLESFRPERIETDESFLPEEKEEVNRYLSPKRTKKSTAEGHLIFFTSGTSGPSKGVVLTSKSLLASAYAGQSCLSCSKDDVILSLLPFSHVFGFVCTLLWPLCYGASIALGRGLRHLEEDILSFKPTILPLIPSLASFLVSKKLLNRELQTLLIGAGPLNDLTVQAIRSLHLRLAFGYGLSETSSGVAISVGGKDPNAFGFCPGNDFKIGSDGGIIIHSEGMMEGYLHDEKSTSEVLKDGWLYTNDLGFIDEDNCLHVLGRKDEVIVLPNGTKFNCAEAENQFASLL